MTIYFKLLSRYQVLGLAGLFFAIFVPRLTNLGEIYTIDERLWLARGANFIQAFATLHLPDTAVGFQPGVTTTWLSGITTQFHSLAAAQGSVAVATGILLIIAAYFLILLFGWRWGLVTAYAVALNPVLLGHSRVIHTDAILGLTLLISVLSFLWATNKKVIEKELYRYIAISGVFGGLAILTKFFALFALVALGLLLVGRVWYLNASWKNIRDSLFAWVGAMIVTIIVAWPALWISPWSTFDFLQDNLLQYGGGRRVGEASTQWWYYLREMYARTTPATTMLFPLGLLAAVLHHRRIPFFALSTLLIVASVYAGLLHIGEDRDARYMIILYLVFDIWAVTGLWFVCRLFPSNIRTLVTNVLIGLYVAALVFQVVRLHPYYLAHYNYLYTVPERYKIGWGEGLEKAAKYIVAKDPDADIAAYYDPVFEYTWKKYGGRGSVEGSDHLSDSTDYLVLSRTMFERAPDSSQTELVNTFLGPGGPIPEKVITINRLPYVWIFNLQQ